MDKGNDTQKPSENNKKPPNDKGASPNISQGEDLIQSPQGTSKGGKIEKPPHDWLAIGIAFLALIVSGFAGYYTSRQADIAEDTAHRQLRAYLGIQIKSWGGWVEKNDPLRIHWALLNYGQTPATMIQVDGQIEVLPFPLPENFVPKYSQILSYRQISVAFPNDTTLIGGVKAKQAFTAIENSKITSNGSDTLAYLFVQITYMDCFGIVHHTRICSFIDPSGIKYSRDKAGHITIFTFKWSNYWKYNDID